MSDASPLNDLERLATDYRNNLFNNGQNQMEPRNTPQWDVTTLSYQELVEVPRLLIRKTFQGKSNVDCIDKYLFLCWASDIERTKWNWKIGNGFTRALFSSDFDQLINIHTESGKLYTIVQRQVELNYYDHNFQDFIIQLNMLYPFYSFALLERCLRGMSREYMDLDGNIIKPFKIVTDKNNPREYKIDDKISNISDTYRLYLNYVADKKIKELHDRFIDEVIIDTHIQVENKYAIISHWRHQLMHGSEIYWKHQGLDVSTYIICLLLLSLIRPDEYNSRRPELRDTFDKCLIIDKSNINYLL